MYFVLVGVYKEDATFVARDFYKTMGVIKMLGALFVHAYISVAPPSGVSGVDQLSHASNLIAPLSGSFCPSLRHDVPCRSSQQSDPIGRVLPVNV